MRAALGRILLTTLAGGFLIIFIFAPVLNVFHQAFGKPDIGLSESSRASLLKGLHAYRDCFFPLPAPAENEIKAARLSPGDVRLLHRRVEQAAKTRQAIAMTLRTVAIIVPINVAFGLCAAWAIAKFRFRGRSLLLSVIDLPFSVSPVVAGLIFILLFGAQGFLELWDVPQSAGGIIVLLFIPISIALAASLWVLANLMARLTNRRKENTPSATAPTAQIARARLRWLLGLAAVLMVLSIIHALHPVAIDLQWLRPSHWRMPDPRSLQWRGFEHGLPIVAARHYRGIIFTPIAIFIASAFVTFPFVARSVIPLMEAQGSDEEQAAISLGASGLQTFCRVTLPNVRWALFYGVILCAARTMGEFGAVSVVSGDVDSNQTMPLRIEKLFQSYNNQAAFALASLLTGVAMVVLIVKAIVGRRAAWR